MEAGDNLRLVIVDNDTAALDLIVLDLGLEGHDIVATALDAAGAIKACDEWRPDVLVVDLRLGPGPNGLDVAHLVRRPGLRVVVHTNYVTPDVVRAAEQLGAVVVEKGNLHALRRAVAAA